MRLRRGEVRYCDLPEVPGSSVQSGRRPCIIVQNNIGNLYSPCVNVIPVTSKTRKKLLPCHIKLRCDRDSIALVEQIRVIPKELVLNESPLYTLNDEELDRLAGAISIQLGLVGVPDEQTLRYIQHGTGGMRDVI